MKIEYSELKQKDAISMADGKKLGKIIDCIIDVSSGQILGVILPAERGFSVFRNTEETYVAWDKIGKIGDDVILVDTAKPQITQEINEDTEQTENE